MALSPFQRAMRLADSRNISLAAAANLIERDPTVDSDFDAPTPTITASNDDIRGAMGVATPPPAARLGDLDGPSTGPLPTFRQEASDPAAARRVAEVRRERDAGISRRADRAEDDAAEGEAYAARHQASVPDAMREWGKQALDFTKHAVSDQSLKDMGQTAASGLVAGGGMAISGLNEGSDAITRSLRRLAEKVGAEKAFDIYMAPAEWVGITRHGIAAGEAIEDVGERMNIAPERREESLNIVANALGQVSGQVAISLVGGPEAGGIAYLGQSFDQMADALRAKGKEGTAAGDAATLVAAPVMAMMEKTGIDRILAKAPAAVKNRVIKGFMDVAIAGGVEASTEIGEQFVQNLALKVSVDPDQALTEGFRESAIGGGGAGAVARAIALGVGGRAKPSRLTEQDRASPLEDDDIESGKDAVAEALGESDPYYSDDEPDVIVRAPHHGIMAKKATPTERAAAPVVEQGRSARQVLKAKVRAAESSGDDTAENPLSSASGRYQFIDATFDSLYKRVYGESLTPEKRAQVKNNPVVQERLMDALVADNEAALRRAGFEPTAGNLYLAHFLGHAGAIKALKNPAAAPSAAVVSANPNLAGMTNADVAAWAGRKMGGKAGAAIDPEDDATIDYADPDYEARVAARQAREDAYLSEAQSTIAAGAAREEASASERARARIDAAKDNNIAADALIEMQATKAAEATGQQPNEEPVFESAEEGARQVAWQNVETGELRPFESAAPAVGEPAPVTAGPDAAAPAVAPIEVESSAPVEADPSAVAPVATPFEGDFSPEIPPVLSGLTPVATESSSPLADFLPSTASSTAALADISVDRPTTPPRFADDLDAGLLDTPYSETAQTTLDHTREVFTAADLDPPTLNQKRHALTMDAKPERQLEMLTAIENGMIRDGDMLQTSSPRWALDRGFADIGPDAEGYRRGRLTEAGAAKLAELRGEAAPSKQDQLKSKMATKRGVAKAVAPAAKNGSTRVAPPVDRSPVSTPATGAPATDTPPASVAGATRTPAEERLRRKGIERAKDAIDRQVDKIDETLTNHGYENEKGPLKRTLARLVKQGVLDQSDVDAVAPLFKDKDMDAEDIVSEVQGAVQDWAEREKALIDPERPRVKRRVEEGRTNDSSKPSSDGSERAEARPVRDGGGVSGSAQPVAVDGGQGALFDRPLKGAPASVKVGDRQVAFGPLRRAREAAVNYLRTLGRPIIEPTVFAPLSPQRAKRIADAFEAMEHNPSDPETAAAYRAMIDETVAQYRAIEATGLKIEFIDFAKGGDPYAATPRLAQIDVAENNHLWVFRTSDGFGSDEAIDVSDNPLLEETDIVIDGHTLLANDVFRIVHDYFGHIKDGHGFRARGEENAWRSHSAMYSPLARRAMTTETRGQNSWVNYGPHGEQNRSANGEATVFAPQKIGLLPQWVVNDGALDDVFHGTPRDFDEFADNGNPVWVADAPALANTYSNARRVRLGSGDRVIPLKADFKNPLMVPPQDPQIEDPIAWAQDNFGFDLRANGWERSGPESIYSITRSRAFADAARVAGHDAVAIEENGSMTYGALDLGAIRPRFAPVKATEQVTEQVEPAPTPMPKQRRGQPQSPAVIAKLNAARAEVLATLREMGVEGRVQVEVLAEIPNDDGGLPDGNLIAGDYNPWTRLVRVAAMTTDTPSHTARHELIHWMRDVGVLNRSEWSALRKWAESQPELRKWVDKNYVIGGPDGLTQDERSEEMVAEGIARVLTKRANPPGLVGVAIGKVRALIDALLSAFRKGGITSADLAAAVAIIDRIQNGEQIELSDERTGFQASRALRLRADLVSGRITPQEHHYFTTNPRVMYQAAWHGTPSEEFERFDINYLGTGEGAQAFGWGLYFAQSKDIATFYRTKLSERLMRADEAVLVGDVAIKDYFAPSGFGDNWGAYNVASAIADFLDANQPYNGWLDGVKNKALNEYDKAIADNETSLANMDAEGGLHEVERLERASIAEEIENLKRGLALEEAMFNQLAKETITMVPRPKGTLFGVEVPETEDLLDLDASLDDQSPKVKEALAKLKAALPEDLLEEYEDHLGEFGEWTGLDLQKRVLPRMAIDDAFPADVAMEVNDAIDMGQSAKAASLYLKSLGIGGNSYLDSNSRGEGTAQTRNFVIFDDNLVSIRTKQRRVSPLNEPDPAPTLLRDIGNATAGLVSALRWRGDAAGAAFDKWRTTLQDKMLPLLRVQSRVEAALGRPLTDDEDPYSKETLYSSRVGDQLAKLTDNHVEPLLVDLHATGISVDELDEYLYARHAFERNAHVHAINPHFGPDEGSGMTNAEAAQIMTDVRASGRQADFDALAAHVDRLVEFSIQTRVDGGLLSQADATILRNTYRYYVPLRGHEELDPKESGSRARAGKGINITGSETRRAFGRESKANDLLGHVILQAEEAIVRAEKNQVAVAFANLAMANPEPGFWQINPVAQVRTLDTKTGMVVTSSRPMTQAEKDRTVSFKVDGVEQRVLIDPDGNNTTAQRLAASMRNIGPAQMSEAVAMMATVGRYLSLINTSFNPEFVISNALRDLQTASLNLTQHDLDGMVRGVLKDWASMKPLISAHRGERGKLGHTAWDQWVARFNAAGGKVHFNQMDNIDALRTRLTKSLARKGQSKWNTMRWARGFMEQIENANGAVENAIRVAVFKNAIERGKTEQQAAYMAKNVTVNFNRHGTMGPAINALYVFANASIQGSTIMLQAIARSRKVKVAVAAMTVAGFALDMLNRWLDDDDEDGQSFYSKIPEYEKSRNFILMAPWLGNGQYVKMPMTWGYNVFPGMGRLVSERANDNRSTASALGAMATMVLDAFNPIGGTNSWQNFLAPSVLDPVVDIGQNKDFAGRPIAPEQPVRAEDREPESQLAWPQTHKIWKSVAEMMNALGGGDEVTPSAYGFMDNSPETIEHLSSVVVGAAGSFAGRLASLATRGFDPEMELSANDIPFKRKVIGDPPSWRDASSYYQRMQAVEYAIDRLKRYREAGDTEGEAKLMREDGDLLPMAATTKAARKTQKALNKEKRAVAKQEKLGKITDDQAIEYRKVIKEKQEALVLAFNRRWIGSIGEKRAVPEE